MKLVMFLFGALCFISVSYHNNNSKETEFKGTQNDTVIRDIPEWYSNSSFTKKIDARLSTLLKLEPLQNGFDSLQIRIWVDCRNKASSLIILERKKDQWDAIFYSFKISYKEKLDVELYDFSSESKSPKSGWVRFSENLMKTGIIDLPDHMKFSPKYNIPNDANRVLVEIGLLRKYRLYEYPELGLNSNIAEGPEKLQQALKLIESEFNYKRPCQDSTSVN